MKRLCIATLIVCSVVVKEGVVGYCATPNAIREFIGMKAIDSQYNSEEREQIKKDYLEIEEHNRLAQMLIDSNSDRAILDAEIDKQVKVIEGDIKKAEEELVEMFNKGSVKDVKKASSKLSGLENKLKNVREKGNSIPAKLKENKWVDAYKEVLRVESILAKERDIGVVGNVLKSPLGIKLDLLEPYGVFEDKYGAKYDRKEIKIKGNEGINVLSVWKGEVKSITTENGLSKVVIEHSGYMHTQYSNVKDVKVKEGDSVNQYTLIGKLGKGGGSDIYLAFSVYMDKKPVNPLLFFGTNGVNAIKEYTSKSGSKLDMKEYLNVKGSIDGEKVSEKPIYNKTGDVEEGAIVPSVEGKLPNPSNTINKEGLEGDILKRDEAKGSSEK